MCLKFWPSRRREFDLEVQPMYSLKNNLVHFVLSALLKELAGTQTVKLEFALFLSSKCLVIKETPFFAYCFI